MTKATMATMATMAMAGLLILALTGCGSSGGATGTGGTTANGGHAGGGAAGAGGTGGGACMISEVVAGTSSGSISWKSNGTPECAFLALVVRTPATLADTIEIDASTETSASIDIALSSYSGPLGGTYSCQPGNGTTAPYVALIAGDPNGGGGSTTSDCSVTISFTTDSAGTEHAQGTFSGTVTGDGGTDVITDGVFDLTVTISGG